MYCNFKNSVGMALLQNQFNVDTAVWNRMKEKGTKEENGTKEIELEEASKYINLPKVFTVFFPTSTPPLR